MGPMTSFQLLLVLATLVASLVSGIFGMAGGLALMGIFATVLPVPEAMVLHGLAMGFANGTRAWLLRGEVRRDLVLRYLRGAVPAAAAAATLFALGWTPPRPLLLLGLATVPPLFLFLPPGRVPGIEERRGAETCGAVVTSVQVVAGASGPLLDAFYLRSTLDRRAIVGTKAITQTLGHALKVLAFVAAGGAAPGTVAASPVAVAIVVAAVAGTALGRRILERLDDGRFRRWSRFLVLVLCAVLLLRAAITA